MRTICLDLTEDEVAALWREPLARVEGTEFSLPARMAGRVRLEAGCWRTSGHGTTQGYRQITVFNKQRQFHRVVYQLLRGSIPAQHVLDHDATVCGNPDCCNVWQHLSPVTVLINTHRGRAPLYGRAR